jgi:hypothetical protein
MAIYALKNKSWAYQYLNSKLTDLRHNLLGYRTYKVMLTQSLTDAPVATVIDNSLGLDVTYSYVGPGTYVLTTSNALFATPTETVQGKKLEVTITPSSSILVADTIAFTAYPVFFNTVGIQSVNLTTAVNDDDLIGNFCSVVLEIKVYN